ncbi:MAG: PASTA domain-containing protein [Ferruginibacter sp.]|nr:PASTA domain-containing protein [Chitinophagaceae bacterium]
MTSRPLWVNILFAIFLIGFIFLIFLGSLGFLTRHNKILKIPAVTGKSMADASKILKEQGFDVQIQDSVYIDTLPILTVTRQFPEADASVKINRTVYLTVNRSVPPLIVMPRLVGSFRNAVMILKQFGLKLGDTSYRVDFAKNSILSQLYEGKEIRPGTKIPMGSTISLVLGSGLSNITIGVPDLFGLSYNEAQVRLDSIGIGLVPILDAGVYDTLNAYIYRQNPERLNEERRVNRIRPGQLIDIWLSSEPRERPDTTIKTEEIPQ